MVQLLCHQLAHGTHLPGVAAYREYEVVMAVVRTFAVLCGERSVVPPMESPYRPGRDDLRDAFPSCSLQPVRTCSADTAGDLIKEFDTDGEIEAHLDKAISYGALVHPAAHAGDVKDGHFVASLFEGRL